MGFILSKILAFLVSPSNFLVLAALVGLVLTRTRLRRAGHRLTATAVLMIAVCGWSPLGQWLILSLEDRFPAWQQDIGKTPDGIVVLGGGLDDSVSGARGVVALTAAGERMTEAVALALRYPAAKVVFSGGTSRIVFGGETEADSAARLFSSLGLAEGRILLESRSRNTVENAVFSRQLADPRPGERWLLVTSAYHMPRAIGIFRAAGFPVEAYPVDWRTRGFADLMRPFSSLAEGLTRTDIAMREWVALLFYWLTGRSAELLPAP